PEAFHEMTALIDAATESVSLETYILHSDEVGEHFGVALKAAAQRGVDVRVIADAIGARDASRAYFADLRHGGVDVRLFNPPGIRRWLGLLPRDHRKLLVVDEAAGITGGVGIGRERMSGVQRVRRSRWRDT